MQLAQPPVFLETEGGHVATIDRSATRYESSCCASIVLSYLVNYKW